MKAVSNNYKKNIKELGREIAVKISYIVGSEEITLYSDNVYTMSIHYEGDILKSVMKQLDLEVDQNIPLETILEVKFGQLIGSEYEYINYGKFIVYSSEKQEDTGNYKLVCYDKLLYSMKDYETPTTDAQHEINITYPITIRDYLIALCNHIGVGFANSSDNFVNYDKLINGELYLDNDGNSLDYIFRDVLDDLAQVTASTICINDNNQLELRYLNDTINSLTDSKEYHRYADSGGVVRTPSGTRYLGIYEYTACEPYTQYTVTFQHNNSGANLYVAYKDANGNFINRTNYRSSRTFTTPEGAKTMFMYLDASSITFPDIGGYVMLNEGSTAIPYGLYTINEEYLKDINVNFGEVYGPINTITFKRSAESDVISLSQPADLADELKKEIVISENQILNGEDRADYLQGILTQLYGLTYSINDFSSTGITFLDLCDKYNISIKKEENDGTSTTSTYQCIMLNDEINVSQGLEELISTKIPDQSETNYNTTTKDDRGSRRTNLIVDKVNGTITSITELAKNVDILVNGNSEYILTSDETFQDEKRYYIKNGDNYELYEQYLHYEGETTGSPVSLGLYEAVVDYNYYETSDTEFDENTTYYLEISGSYIEYEGSREGNPHELGLYERIEVITGYQLTSDVSFIEGKQYYEQQYEIGDTIPSDTIYELTQTEGLTDEFNSLSDSVQSQMEGFNGRITGITNSVTQIQTETYTKTQVQNIVNGVGVDGVRVSYASNETATFDNDGLLIQTEDTNNNIISKTTGRFNEKGVQIKQVENGSEGDEIFFSGYVDNNRFGNLYNGSSIVYTKNLIADGYTQVGVHGRFEKYIDENNKEGVGFFIV